MRHFTKTFLLLAIAACLILITSFFIASHYFSLNIFEIDVSMSGQDYLRIYALIMLFYAFLYNLLHKWMRFRFLSWIHIALTIILPFVLFWINYNYSKSLVLIETSDPKSYASDHQRLTNLFITAFAMAQALPLINLVCNLFVKR